MSFPVSRDVGDRRSIGIIHVMSVRSTLFLFVIRATSRFMRRRAQSNAQTEFVWKRPIVYASRTGTRAALDLFRSWGWKLMVSAKGVQRSEGFPYALDNGAWWAHANNKPFDEAAFQKALAALGAGADWVALPDVVSDAAATFDLAARWFDRLGGLRSALVVQDGMSVEDVDRWLVGRRVHVLFVGGSTPWKESTMAMWSTVAHDRGLLCHVGRVNTRRRLKLCVEARVDSVDGSGMSQFTKHAIAFRRWCLELGVF